MSVRHLRVFREENASVDAASWAVLLSSYNSGATEGSRLGTAGYSYDFVARLFSPLLQRLGTVVNIRDPKRQLTSAVEDARRQGLEPVHVSFHPFQDAHLSADVHNVVVPAWEFPDVPNVSFDGNSQNNWVETANRCSLLLVGGPFTARALDEAGVKTPIRIVPVPTPDSFFQLPGWQAREGASLDCSAYVLPQINAAHPMRQPQRLSEGMRRSGLRAYRHLLKPCLPQRIEPVIAASLRAGVAAWQAQSLPYRRIRGLNLGGVVYTSIFNPDDGRKNWEDTITAFIHALRDCDDATLVLKLIARDRRAVDRVLAFYHRLDVAHRCRLVVIPGFLSEAEMLELARASTYYLTSTRAEGNCLPLMNYLAAGRPGISPAHTAIGDYFDGEAGFVVESHPEPCAWPQDSRLRWRTTWHRLVWTSLVEQIRRGYQVAKSDRTAYDAMAQAARERMRQWAHPEAVWPHLRSAMELLTAGEESPSATASSASSTMAAAPGVVSLRSKELSVGKRQRFASAGSHAASSGAGRMRVVVSLLSFRPGKIGGTETYLRKLIAELPAVNRCDDIILLMDRDLAAENICPDMKRAVVDLSARQIIRARGLEAVSPYRALAVEKAIERLQPDVLFFPQQSIFPKHVAAPCVLVVHDLYHLFLPQYLSRGQRLFRQRNYAYSISRADHIIAISQFTKSTIVEQYGVTPEDVTVVPHGWEARAGISVEPDSEIGGKYLYYPAITRPHKNHRDLLNSIAALKAQGRFDHRLVLSGIQTPHWTSLCRQIEELGLVQMVQHVGYVSYDRVRRLYSGADCVVFPSLFEGFGLPVMEAVEAGKKVLVSRLPVFSELGVPERFQIDFADPEQLQRAIEEPGATVLEKRPWNWSESAAATMDVLGMAAGRQSAAQALARAA